MDAPAARFTPGQRVRCTLDGEQGTVQEAICDQHVDRTTRKPATAWSWVYRVAYDTGDRFLTAERFLEDTSCL